MKVSARLDWGLMEHFVTETLDHLEGQIPDKKFVSATEDEAVRPLRELRGRCGRREDSSGLG